jgi:hypothetical protein
MNCMKRACDFLFPHDFGGKAEVARKMTLDVDPGRIPIEVAM